MAAVFMSQTSSGIHGAEKDATTFSHADHGKNMDMSKKKLDDGWPESVEEQGLLLLVWRHHITKQ